MLVLHFGLQCPWTPWVIRQARQAAARLGEDLQVVDVARQPEYARRYRMFFPFMTVIDGDLRLSSPTPACELVRLARGEAMPTPAETLVERPAGLAQAVRPLVAASLLDTCWLCIDPPGGRGCRAKVAWVANLSKDLPNGLLGFAAIQENRVVGAVEFIPASLVPYPLPDKTPQTAFITCLYSLEEGPDYLLKALACLLEYAPSADFHQVQVVAGKRLPYPNGPQSFFQACGFDELAKLDHAALGTEVEPLVLLEKQLS